MFSPEMRFFIAVIIGGDVPILFRLLAVVFHREESEVAPHLHM